MDVKTEEDQSNEAFLPPPLPNLTPTPDLPTISTFGRKRTLDFDVTLSSDPPLFSSDDLPASSENYAHRRKKRRYPGTWWGAKACEGEDQAMELRRRTRGLKRTADSGVWMGSEDTDLSLEEGSEPRLVDDLPKWEPPNEVNVGSRPMVSQGTDFTGARVDATMGSSVQKVDNIEEEEESLEQRAIQIVQYCLDESIETVDLS